MRISKTLQLDGRLSDKTDGALNKSRNVVFDTSENKYRAEHSYDRISTIGVEGVIRGMIPVSDGAFILTHSEVSYTSTDIIYFVQNKYQGSQTDRLYPICHCPVDVITNKDFGWAVTDSSEFLEGTYIVNNNGDIILVIVGANVTPRFIKLIKVADSNNQYHYELDLAYNPSYVFSLSSVSTSNTIDSDGEQKTRIWPDFASFDLTVLSEQGTGSIKIGNYAFYISFEIISNIYTKWSPCSTYYNVHSNNVVRDDEVLKYRSLKSYVVPNDRADYSLSAYYSNLPSHFSKAKIAVLIETKDGREAYEFQPINYSSGIDFTYSGQPGTPLDPAELITPFEGFTSVRTVANTGEELLFGNTVKRGFFNYQPYANGIVVKLNIANDDIPDTRNREVPTVGNKLAIDLSGIKGLTPGEVYALYVHVVYADGTISEGFHIPGRKVLTDRNNPSSLIYPSTAGGTYFLAETGRCSKLLAGVDDYVKTTYANKLAYQVLDTYDSNTGLGYWENVDEYYDSENSNILDASGSVVGTVYNPTQQHEQYNIFDIPLDAITSYTNVRHHKIPSLAKLLSLTGNTNKRITLEISNLVIPTSLSDEISGFAISYAKRNTASSIVQSYGLGFPDETIPHGSGSGTVDVINNGGDKYIEFYSHALQIVKPSIYANLLKLEAYQPTDFLTAGEYWGVAGYANANSIELDNTQPTGYEISAGLFASKPIAGITQYSYVPENNSYADNANRTDHLLITFDRDFSVYPFTMKLGKDGAIYSLYCIRDNIYNTKENQVLIFAGYKRKSITTIINSIVAGDTNELQFDTYNVITRGFVNGVNEGVLLYNSQFDNYIAHTNPFNAYGNIVTILTNTGSVDLTNYGGEGIQLTGSFRAIGADVIPALAGVSFCRKTQLVISFPTYCPINLMASYAIDEDYTNDYLAFRTIRYDVTLDNVNDFTLGSPYDISLEYMSSYPHDIFRGEKYSLGDEDLAFKILPGNSHTVSKTKGDLFKLTASSKKVYIQYENALFVAEVKDTMEVVNTSISLVKSDLFATKPIEIIPQEGGYIGTKSRYATLLFKGNYLVCDSDRGMIFIINDQGIEEISKSSAFISDNLLGLNNFKIGVNPYVSSEVNPNAQYVLVAGYDDVQNRVLFSVIPSWRYGISSLTSLGRNLTLSYSLTLKGFTAIHDYHGTKIYVPKRRGLAVIQQDGSTIKACNIDADDTLGYYGSVGSSISYPSFVDVIVQAKGWSLVNSVLYETELRDSNSKLVYAAKPTHIQLYNDYQATSLLSLDETNNAWYETSNIRNIFRTNITNDFRDVLDLENAILLMDLWGDMDASLFSNERAWYEQNPISSRFVVVRLYNSNAVGYNNYNIFFDTIFVNSQSIIR